jgi:hypothetical protein
VPPAPSAPQPGEVRAVFEPPTTTWDLNLEGALKFYSTDGPNTMGFLRARPGVLFIRDPAYFSVGPTYEWSPISPATFGLQGEFLYYDLGLWAQVGGLVDTHALFGVDGSVGWSVVGIEAQYRSYEGLGNVFAAYVKLRIPVGILAHALSRRSQHHDEMRTRNGTH